MSGPTLLVAAGTARRAYEAAEARGIPYTEVAWLQRPQQLTHWVDADLLVDSTWGYSPRADELADAIGKRLRAQAGRRRG
jgi:hypothetical protein